MKIKDLTVDLGNLRDQFCVFGLDHIRFKELSQKTMLAFECLRLSGSKSQVKKAHIALQDFSNLVAKMDEAQYQNIDLTPDDLKAVDFPLTLLIKELHRTPSFVTENVIAAAGIYVDEQFKDVHAYMERITFVPTEDDPQRGC